MAKEVVISTSGLNSYGSRVLTEGIDLEQYVKNPVLLWMHRRSWDGNAMPIGRMENLRLDGDRLIGTPVFDKGDEFARQIADKWENGFLRMVSAGLRVLDTSMEPADLLPGQTRATITRCRLEEVSIVDIGANDDALQLYDAAGRVMTLASGMNSEVLPLLALTDDSALAEPSNNPKQPLNMREQLIELLELSADATEQDVLEAVHNVRERMLEAEDTLMAHMESVVDQAVAERRITADMKEKFMMIGRANGMETLQLTLQLCAPKQKPTDVIRPTQDKTTGGGATYQKLSDVPATDVPGLKESDPEEYARLYAAEYGVEI